MKLCFRQFNPLATLKTTLKSFHSLRNTWPLFNPHRVCEATVQRKSDTHSTQLAAAPLFRDTCSGWQSCTFPRFRANVVECRHSEKLPADAPRSIADQLRNGIYRRRERDCIYRTPLRIVLLPRYFPAFAWHESRNTSFWDHSLLKDYRQHSINLIPGTNVRRLRLEMLKITNVNNGSRVVVLCADGKSDTSFRRQTRKVNCRPVCSNEVTKMAPSVSRTDVGRR